jgi:hypothetical protein
MYPKRNFAEEPFGGGLFLSSLSGFLATFAFYFFFHHGLKGIIAGFEGTWLPPHRKQPLHQPGRKLPRNLDF